MTDVVLTVGVVTKPHGVRGEVRVYPYSDDICAFLKDRKLTLRRKEKELTLKAVSCRMQGGMALVRFEGIDSRDSAETLRGFEILVNRSDAPELPEGEYYVCDLEGLTAVTEEGVEYGVLTGVLHTGANDVYEVTGKDGKTILVPAVKDYVKSIDMDGRVMVFRLDKGML